MKYILAACILLIGCTENQRARQFGGDMTVNLDKGERLVTATWKETSLWLLTKQDTTKPSVYRFKENSGYDYWNGVVTIKEQ